MEGTTSLNTTNKLGSRASEVCSVVYADPSGMFLGATAAIVYTYMYATALQGSRAVPAV